MLSFDSCVGVADICKRPQNVTNSDLVEHGNNKTKETSEKGEGKAAQVSGFHRKRKELQIFFEFRKEKQSG